MILKKSQPLFLIFFLLVSIGVAAQNSSNDTLWVKIHDARAMIEHSVEQGENLYSIALQYSVPALVLSQTNDVPFYEKLEPERKLFVPLGNYNYLKVASGNTAKAKALYYKKQENISKAQLSKYLGISEAEFAQLNKKSGGEASTLLMGYVLYENPNAPKAKETIVEPIAAVAPGGLAPSSTNTPTEVEDTTIGAPSEWKRVYVYQTSDEQYVDSMDGMVAFFKPQTSVNEEMLFAFSDEVPKGKVVKVRNPSNGNYVFAKVIGALPKTKQYINAKLGLDGRARKMLETREVKLWCRFYFKY